MIRIAIAKDVDSLEKQHKTKTEFITSFWQSLKEDKTGWEAILQKRN